MIDAGIITDGMLPKVEACLSALEGGVKKAHIIDGRIAHSLLLEIYTEQGHRHRDRQGLSLSAASRFAQGAIVMTTNMLFLFSVYGEVDERPIGRAVSLGMGSRGRLRRFAGRRREVTDNDRIDLKDREDNHDRHKKRLIYSTNT